MSRFLQYIHNLRGLAILFVVGVHAGGYDADWVSHPGLRHFLQTFFDPSEGNGTVLFLFIGGFLFQHLTHNQFDYKKFLEQKFLNIILPYIIISIPLILIRLNTNFDSLSLPEGFQNRPVVFQFFYHLILGTHMPPFWFISAIVLFYFSSPVLHALDNRTFYRYFFPLVILSCLFTYRPEHNANPLLAYLHFIPIYITGMWASFNKERILALGWKLLGPLLAVYTVLTALDLAGLLPLLPREFTFEQVLSTGSLVFNIYMFKAIVLCFSLLLIFYKLREREMPLLEILGHYSFGVFFVHYVLISVSRKALEAMNITIDFSIVTYLIYFVFVLMLSIMTVYLVKRVTGRYSRYLIGS
jgi:probable poly-beta-1,6-N-acetyl-D-glucosamine export protein